MSTASLQPAHKLTNDDATGESLLVCAQCCDDCVIQVGPQHCQVSKKNI